MHKQPNQVRLHFAYEVVDISINTLKILETFKLRRIITRDVFFQSKQISLSGVTQLIIRKFKMLYFQNQKRYRTGNWEKDLFLGYPSTLYR